MSNEQPVCGLCGYGNHDHLEAATCGRSMYRNSITQSMAEADKRCPCDAPSSARVKRAVRGDSQAR